MSDQTIRADIVARCLELDASGLNRGSSGNISVRVGDAMLITPSGVAAKDLAPGMMAHMPLSGEDGAWTGPLKPSSEWRFHLDLFRARPDLGAIVHTHAPFSTIIAIARMPIPAIHYMMAAFGGPDIRCAGYARYGTATLSANVVAAMQGRNGCLMANHGMIAAAATLARATWLAHELEAMAHQYFHVLQIGGGHILTDEQLSETALGFATYGVAAPAS